jgi:hypothetical protein
MPHISCYTPVPYHYVSAIVLSNSLTTDQIVEKYLVDHEIFASYRPMLPAVGLRFNCRWAMCSAFNLAKNMS